MGIDGAARISTHRDVAVSEEARAHVSACGDIEVLDTWIKRAVTVSTVDELFA